MQAAVIYQLSDSLYLMQCSKTYSFYKRTHEVLRKRGSLDYNGAEEEVSVVRYRRYGPRGGRGHETRGRGTLWKWCTDRQRQVWHSHLSLIRPAKRAFRGYHRKRPFLCGSIVRIPNISRNIRRQRWPSPSHPGTAGIINMIKGLMAERSELVILLNE